MKTFLRIASATILISAALPMSAFAQQDSATAGLVMATPSSVSFIWHVSGSVALRPEIGFAASKAETMQGGGTESTSTTWTPGFSALFYVAQMDALRTYLTPRYAYSRAHVESSSTLGSSESTGTSHSVSGSFGAEYAVHRRFAVFGEIGINYTHAESETTDTNSWNHRSAVGAILYF